MFGVGVGGRGTNHFIYSASNRKGHCSKADCSFVVVWIIIHWNILFVNCVVEGGSKGQVAILSQRWGKG